MSCFIILAWQRVSDVRAKIYSMETLPKAAVQSRTVKTASSTVILSSPLPMIHRSVRAPMVKLAKAWEKLPTPRTTRARKSSGTSPLADPVETRADDGLNRA